MLGSHYSSAAGHQPLAPKPCRSTVRCWVRLPAAPIQHAPPQAIGAAALEGKLSVLDRGKTPQHSMGHSCSLAVQADRGALAVGEPFWEQLPPAVGGQLLHGGVGQGQDLQVGRYQHAWQRAPAQPPRPQPGQIAPSAGCMEPGEPAASLAPWTPAERPPLGLVVPKQPDGPQLQGGKSQHRAGAQSTHIKRLPSNCHWRRLEPRTSGQAPDRLVFRKMTSSERMSRVVVGSSDTLKFRGLLDAVRKRGHANVELIGNERRLLAMLKACTSTESAPACPRGCSTACVLKRCSKSRRAPAAGG